MKRCLTWIVAGTVRRARWGAVWAAAVLTTAAHAAPVVMISIDGLRPGDVLDAPARGLKVPTLTRLAAEGVYAAGVRGVLPTLTYPSHTTLITGVAPRCHGVANNLTFDPNQRNQDGWYWYAEDIRVPTLWDLAHAAGLKTANVHWPVSVGQASIDLNLPQIWRTGQADDRKLVKALATRGLVARLEAQLGPYANGIDETVEGDEIRARFAAALIREDRPDFTTVYLTGLDHVQHLYGPDTPQAHAALERIDAAVASLVSAAKASLSGAAIVVVSDHGFAPVAHDVNLFQAFADAGLLTLSAARTSVSTFEATPWFAGGAAQIVLARPGDKALALKVEAVLDGLKADPRFGVDRWIGPEGVKAMGGSSAASYVLFFKPGFEAAKSPAQPLTGPSLVKGMHGYDPAFQEMRSTFIASGGPVKATGALSDMDMRQIAPYVAGLLGVQLPKPPGDCAN